MFQTQASVHPGSTSALQGKTSRLRSALPVEGPILKGTASAIGTSFNVDEVIFKMLTDYGYATVPDVAAIAGVTERTARRHISSLVADGKIMATGMTRNRRYTLPLNPDE